METSDTAGRRTTIVVREPDAATQLAPQSNQLKSLRRILCFKPAFDLNGETMTARTKTE
jgi:hypothetical protein